MTATAEDPAAAKDSRRRSVRARRAARMRDPHAGAADAEALARTALLAPALQDATRVAAYLAMRGEPDLRPLLTLLRARGTEVLLPVVRDGDVVLAWAHDTGEVVPGPRLPSGGRIDEPTGPATADLVGTQVVLLPALAVDTRGARLGQGGGYYDRTLAELARRRPSVHPLLVAVVHDDEVLDAGRDPLPEQRHDHRVTAVLTPTRWLDLRS